MKKIIAVILAAVMLFSVCVTGFAAEKKDVTPVIVVSGVGSRGYYMDAGTENEISEEPELKVETVIKKERLRETMEEILRVHPYEEPAINVIPLLGTGLRGEWREF